MARLRRFGGYKTLERPYTRKSKYRAKQYVRGTPNHKIVRFDMGSATKEFAVKLRLKVNEDLQIRHNAIESARQTSNRILEKEAGKGEYHMKIVKYPHHILRENPLASGAGADRMSTGMKKSFGKPIGVAAQFAKGEDFIIISIAKSKINIAKKALIRAKNKLPCSCSIVVE